MAAEHVEVKVEGMELAADLKTSGCIFWEWNSLAYEGKTWLKSWMGKFELINIT